MIKYVLHPGFVFSKNDSDRHYMGPGRLAELYGVPLDECLIFRRSRPVFDKNLIHLCPNYYGDYEIPVIGDDGWIEFEENRNWQA